MELKHRQILSAQVDLSKFNKANFEKATDEEKKQQDVMGESTTFFKDGMRRLRKNPLAMGSIIVLVLILLTIIIAPHVCPYKYSEIISVNGVRDKSAANLGPFEYSKLETKYMNETGEKHLCKGRQILHRPDIRWRDRRGGIGLRTVQSEEARPPVGAVGNQECEGRQDFAR